jgi:DNA ligase (NAD+)
VRRLIHWASRAAADIEAVGPVWIERLNEHKLLERSSDFYALTREQLLEFEGIADVSADRMIESIQATRGVGLRRRADRAWRSRWPPRRPPRASAARATRRSRGRGRERGGAAGGSDDIGPEGGRRRCLAPQPRERAGGARAAARARRLRSTCSTRTCRPRSSSDAPLADKTVVITGSIADPRSGEKIPRPTFQRLCERAGATTASSVSRNTDMLICGSDVGASKTAKAEKLGVEVVDQDVIWKLLIDAGVA